MKKHTMSAYDNELKNIKDALKKMSSMIEKQLVKTLKVLHDKDVALAESVLKNDEKIDNLRGKIEQQIISIFARRQPMANDLRWLISSLQIADELERIGDYANNISKRMELLEDMPDELKLVTEKLETMIELVIAMFIDVIKSFLEGDIKLAVKTWKKDKKVDLFHRKIFAEYMSFMIDANEYVEMSTKLLFAVKTTERIGDRISNIAEKVYYTNTGHYLI